MRTRGFTIIELLIAIAVIGILVIFALVRFEQAKAKARDTHVRTEFANLVSGLKAYYSAYHSYPCGDDWRDPPGTMVDSTIDDLTFLLGCKPTDTWCPLRNIHPEYDNYCQKLGPVEGLQLGNLIPLDPEHPIDHPHPGRNPWTYVYQVSNDRQKFVLWTILEEDTAAMENDGGLCDYAYEVGSGAGIIPLYDAAIDASEYNWHCNSPATPT